MKQEQNNDADASKRIIIAVVLCLAFALWLRHESENMPKYTNLDPDAEYTTTTDKNGNMRLWRADR